MSALRLFFYSIPKTGGFNRADYPIGFRETGR